jgi:hypothetical protein
MEQAVCGWEWDVMARAVADEAAKWRVVDSWVGGMGARGSCVPPRPGACDAGGGGGQRRRRFLVFSSRYWQTGCGWFSAACDRALLAVAVCARVPTCLAVGCPPDADQRDFSRARGAACGAPGVGFGGGACGKNSVEAAEHARTWWTGG